MRRSLHDIVKRWGRALAAESLPVECLSCRTEQHWAITARAPYTPHQVMKNFHQCDTLSMQNYNHEALFKTSPFLKQACQL